MSETPNAASLPGAGPVESERASPRPADDRDATRSVGRRLRAAAGQYLTFHLGDDVFGVSVLQVREILEYSAPTPIPLTPPWILGVLNLRGNVVPVIGLARRFGLVEAEMTPRTCIVIVEVELDGETNVMGILVDAVSRVVDLTAETLEAPPEFGARVRVDYLTGMGKVDDRLVPLLDTDLVLSTDELMQTLDAAADRNGETREEGTA